MQLGVVDVFMCFQEPLLSHDLVLEVSQRALACITWKSHHEPCGLCQQTINGQRTRLIEVLEGLLEMGAGKHLSLIHI